MDLKDVLSDEYFPTTLSNAIPAIGPRSFRRHRKDNLATSIDTPISRRITDKSLLASLHRDTSIKIRQPSTVSSRTSKQSSKSGSISSRRPRKLHLYPPQEPPKFPKFDVPPHRRKTPEPELSELTEDFIKDTKENVPDNVEDCRVIKSDLKKLRTYQVDEDQYEEALKTHQYIAIIDSRIFELDQSDNSLANLRHSVTKHQEIEQVVATYLAEWDKTYEEFLETMQEELDKIEEENRAELEEFDNKIPKGLDPQYSKASQRLLNLRSAEKRLAYSNQLPFALQLKQRADMIEKQEAEQQYYKQCQLIEARRERLIQSHENRIKTFLDHIKSTRNVMIQARNKTVGGYLRRLNYIDKDIDDIAMTTNIDVDAICNSRINEDRAEFVKQEEMANPIPLFQPGTAFMISRKKIKEAQEMERSQQSQSQQSYQSQQSQQSHRSSYYSRSRHSRSQSQSNQNSEQNGQLEQIFDQQTDILTGEKGNENDAQNADENEEENGQLEQIFDKQTNILTGEEENVNEDANENEEENVNENEEENVNENANENEEENGQLEQIFDKQTNILTGEEENVNENADENEEENANEDVNENEEENVNENEEGDEEDENAADEEDESQNSQTQPVSSNPRRKINANNTMN